MNLRQTNSGGHKLRRLISTAPAALLLVLAACGGSEPAATPSAGPTAQPAAAQTAGPSAAETGGIAVETGSMTLPGAAADATSPTQPTPTPPALQVGAVLTATSAVTLYAEPDPAAPRFAQYTPGSRFTVVEPDSEHAAYPVETDGHRWYRVRAEDGLVGWMTQE